MMRLRFFEGKRTPRKKPTVESMSNSIAKQRINRVQEVKAFSSDFPQQESSITAATGEGEPSDVSRMSLADWIVIDIPETMTSTTRSLRNVEGILRGVHHRELSLTNHGVVRIPRELQFIVEMESVKNITPETATCSLIICLQEDVVSALEEFEMWIAKKKAQNRFYGKLHTTLSWLFIVFFLEAVKFFKNNLAPKKVILTSKPSPHRSPPRRTNSSRYRRRATCRASYSAWRCSSTSYERWRYPTVKRWIILRKSRQVTRNPRYIFTGKAAATSATAKVVSRQLEE